MSYKKSNHVEVDG